VATQMPRKSQTRPLFEVEPEHKFRGADYVRNMDVDKVTKRLREFVAERDWNKFHSKENLAKSISIEAAELLECFQWNSEADIDQVRDELADVLTYCFLLSDKYGLDPVEIILEKLEKTREKYPIEKARGKSEKYDRL